MKPATPASLSVPLHPILAECQAALSAYVEAPDSPEVWQSLRAKRAAAARAIAALAGQPDEAAILKPAFDLQLKLASSGALDLEADPEDLALANALASQGVAGLLAAMLLVPAWQWPAAPTCTAIPEGLWSAYTAWLFDVPKVY